MESTTLSINPFRNIPFLTKIVATILTFVTIITLSVLTTLVVAILSYPYEEKTINIKHQTVVLLGIVAMYYYDKYMITKFYHSPINEKIATLEEKLVELEDENQYLVSMDNMRQEEWEKLMRTQSKVCSQMKTEFEKKFKNYNKILKKIEKSL
jgi:hypothetical protein